jgi:hypothetical protein
VESRYDRPATAMQKPTGVASQLYANTRLITENPLPWRAELANSIRMRECEMEENIQRTPVEKRTPVTSAGEAVSALCDIWEIWKFEERVTFWDEVFKVLWDDEGTSGEDLLKKIKEYEDMTDWEGEPLVPGFKPAIVSIAIMQASCAFAVQAMKAKKNSASAWAYACEANHWLGILQGYISGRAVTGTENARKGGIAKNAPMAKLQAWVLERYEQGVWPSKHNASFEIAPEAIKKAVDFETRLSQQRAQKTIYDWLRESKLDQ